MSTDGGGCILIENHKISVQMSTGAYSLASLNNFSTSSKMSDAQIKALALNSNYVGEILITNGSSSYILKYPKSTWNSFSSRSRPTFRINQNKAMDTIITEGSQLMMIVELQHVLVFLVLIFITMIIIPQDILLSWVLKSILYNVISINT